MRKGLAVHSKLIRSTYFISVMLAAKVLFATSTLLLPYASIHAGADYLSDFHSLANFENYLPGTHYSLSGNSALLPYVYVKNNQLMLSDNIALETKPTFSKSCSVLNNNPDELLCNLTVTSDQNQIGTLPVILNYGLRAKTIEEIIAARVQGNIVNATQPYYFEISATPNDFSQNSIPVVDLNNYFTAPDNKITFTLDATYIAGKQAPCPIKVISGVNQAVCANTDDFSIDPTSGYFNAKNLHPGIYQINIHAQRPINSLTEHAWQTFYLNVQVNNPTLADWKAGAVAATNVLGSFPSIYVYSAKDPQKNPDWASDYQDYANDLGNINSTYLTKHPIKTALVEIISMLYPNGSPNWPLKPNPNPENQITNLGIVNNRSTMASWINALIAPFQSQGVGVTLNYTFDNHVKADFLSFNRRQQDILADAMVAPIIQYNLDGIAMDLEGGFNQPAAAEIFKKIADRLAYHGKWFSFYYFGDIFKPNMFAAFGPLGIANISTYDVGQYRAPETDSDALPATLSYEWGGFTPEQALTLYTNFSYDKSCTTINNAGYYSPISYCNLSINDSYSENNRRLKDNYHQISTHDAIIYFNGKYQLALPLADSATEWSAVEIWNPDFTPAIFKTGRILTTTACAVVDNTFFVKNAHDLACNPASSAYKTLAACLLADAAHQVVSGLSMQAFSSCGSNIPYAQCILVSSLPGSALIGQPGVLRSTTLDYVRNNIIVYQDTNQAHAAGYSIFALENAWTAPAGAFGQSNAANITVQEPWYIGYHFPNNPDPYFNQADINMLWQSFAELNL